MQHYSACLLFLAVALVRAEILDRIAVTFGTDVITETEILREIRITAFINGEKLDFNSATKRKAADRLIEQKLIRREVELGRYPEAAANEVDQMLNQVKKSRFPNDTEYQRALKQYGIDEEDLKAHLRWQLTALHFIDLRFRPGIRVTDEEIRNYYETRQPELKKPRSGESTDLDDVRDQIEQKLTAERVDQQLDEWLKETRKRNQVKFREEVFR